MSPSAVHKPDNNTKPTSSEIPNTDTTTTSSTAPGDALPSLWYRSQALYDLEKRAIFSKQWMLVSHRLRFTKPGDFVRMEVACFPFFVIMDREGEICAFHNVCRHRAYPVMTQDAGTKSILACLYHGWSYGLNGKLAKAPSYDTVDTFDKSKNGLFPIHVHIDRRGFVWVNLDAAETPSLSWESRFQGVDLQPRLDSFNMDDYVFDHAWEMKGEYNWKTLIDNYNECYHCRTSHPLIAASCDLTKYKVEVSDGHIQHFIRDKPGKDTGGFAPTFFFPNASVTMTTPYFYLMRVIPTSATTTTMQYEVFRNKNATDAEFLEMDKFFKQVENEDKDLCNGAQINLNSGTYVYGELQPEDEKGVLYFQRLVKDAVMEHRKEEVAVGGQEIWPARQKLRSDWEGNDLVRFCQRLEACGAERKELAW